MAHERCGKIVVATREEELPQLAELERREGLSGLEEFASRKLQAREGDGT